MGGSLPGDSASALLRESVSLASLTTLNNSVHESHQSGASVGHETRPSSLDLREANEPVRPSEDKELYPAAWKLAAIMVGLCFSCILVALVSHL